MSVTFHLYKIRDDVEFLGNLADKVKWGIKNDEALTKLETEHGFKGDFTSDELEDWENRMIEASFSDGKKHDIFDKNCIKQIFKGTRGLNRLLNRLDGLNFKRLENENGYIYNYIVVDEIVYRQGWFLKKKFFNKEITACICTTKKQMENFFKQYIDYNSNDTRGKEAAEAFLNAWEPGMLFKCVW